MTGRGREPVAPAGRLVLSAFAVARLAESAHAGQLAFLALFVVALLLPRTSRGGWTPTAAAAQVIFGILGVSATTVSLVELGSPSCGAGALGVLVTVAALMVLALGFVARTVLGVIPGVHGITSELGTALLTTFAVAETAATVVAPGGLALFVPEVTSGTQIAAITLLMVLSGAAGANPGWLAPVLSGALALGALGLAFTPTACPLGLGALVTALVVLGAGRLLRRVFTRS